MKRSRTIPNLALAGAFAFAGVAATAFEPESNDPIVLPLNEWTGQHVTTRIAGETLKKMGYNVEYVTAGYVPQVQGVMDGNLTAAMEIWEQTIQEHFARAIDSGQAVDLGETGIDSREGWIYPAYMEEQCPGLPDYEALQACQQQFATPETFPKGRLLDYPADWAPDNDKRLEALGIDFVAIPSGSEGAAAAEYKAAVAAKRPIVMMFYSPHWLFAEADPRWIELPESSDECYEDAAVGPNPDATHDCGWPTGWVRKLAWAGTEGKWPAAYRFLDTFQIDNATQEQLVLEIDVNGVSQEDAIAAWMHANQATWQGWIESATE
ncbi:ABC transporter substrate-binding protein [Roseovarius sp. SK2]|uniref:ABC transporter substrate-binding protein n=1 Tax=Roseovarius sp. SK2 TaxID=3028381 RepID=UPI00237B06DA|nr:ABC transporter substrate-binding protein [Roseovarius sp. SK2]MDD9727708.1 ABC transporter substrate-binding protein [Roseovarius sp. SK2]